MFLKISRFLLLLPLVGSIHGALRYEVTDLGTLGGNTSRALSINDSNQVVGGSAPSGDFPVHAFLWQNGIMKDLGALAGQTYDSFAYGINHHGQIVGQTDIDPLESHAFLRDLEIMSDLKTLGGKNSWATGINNMGQIVGYSRDPNDAILAYLYSDGVMAGLGTLGGASSVANAINDAGQIVGKSELTGVAGVIPVHAFLYAAGKMEDLKTLGGDNSRAEAINASGQVVGASQLVGNTQQHAFLYEDGKMSDLGSPGGNSEALGINDAGVVVGSYLPGGSSQSRAFIYHEGVMNDLNTLIPPGSGWLLANAYSINTAGCIVGVGIVGGKTHAFLLTPLPPAAGPTVSIAGKKKISVSKGNFVLRGRANGEVDRITVKIGKKNKIASGTANWSVRLALKPGRNKISAIATGPGGASAPAFVTIERK